MGFIVKPCELINTCTSVQTSSSAARSQAHRIHDMVGHNMRDYSSEMRSKTRRRKAIERVLIRLGRGLRSYGQIRTLTTAKSKK
eukprot:1848129-Pyramimonas_sp.AAC.2